MAITPLISALRLALPRITTLLGEPDQSVADEACRLVERSAAGEDVDDEALLFLRRRELAQLRRFVHGLLTEDATYRSGAVAAPRLVPHDEGGDAASAVSAGHVNAYVAAATTDDAWSAALVPSGEYGVLVHVGTPSPLSLLDPTDAALTLPAPLGDGVWLRAVLGLDSEETLAVADLFLAGNGESFSCGCAYGGDHATDCSQVPWTRLAFRAPPGTTRATAQLIIYREAVALHVQGISLPTGDSPGAPSSRLVARVTASFTELSDLTQRSASVVLSPGSSSLTVNGLGFTAAPFAVTPGVADTSALNLRQVLYNVHLATDRGVEVSRYDANLGKPHDQFVADLAQLARHGSALYTRLFTPQNPDPTTRYSLPALLRHEALLRARPATLQVTDRDYSDRSVLWQSVYDLPMGSDPATYVPCAALQTLAELAALEQPPALCPFDEKHRGELNVLCPWGFWGLSTFLEQPADRTLAARTVTSNPSCLLVMGPDLEPLAAEHRQRLIHDLGAATLRTSAAASATVLAGDLAGDDVDVAYFYCHCGYEQGAADAGSDRYLALDGYRVMAQDVISWAQSRLWPRDHWRSRRPLVVLNGCHTSEYTARTLSSFVPAFADWAGAGGVLGTEITLDQLLANAVAELVLADLWAGRSIGEAIRRMRWQLLARGNIMGLAYTPHCAADLQITTSGGKHGSDR